MASEVSRRPCAGRRLADWLREQGHNVVESRERGDDPGDRALLDWAASEGRVLVTIDMDFGRLIFVEGATHAGLVRLLDVPAGKRIAIMKRILTGPHAATLSRSVVTVRGGRIRVSRQG